MDLEGSMTNGGTHNDSCHQFSRNILGWPWFCERKVLREAYLSYVCMFSDIM
jgi:hypothetical protein